MDRSKIIKAVAFGVIVVVLGLTVASNVFAKDVDYKLAHQELDERLKADMDAWIVSNGVRRFCMPKAKLLQEEITIRSRLGDNLAELQARKDRVISECSETIKQVLFL